MTWKYYAVAVGRQTGIFQDWDMVKSLVIGYSGSIYKGFKTLAEAQNFLQPSSGVSANGPNTVSINTSHTTATVNSNAAVTTSATTPTSAASASISPILQVQKVIAYTDGSFINNSSGYGVILIFSTQVIQGYGHVPLSVGNTNNVAELYPIYVALSAVPDGDMDIYTDSEYALNVITGKKRAYVNLELIAHIQSKMVGRKVNIYHVYGHTGIQHNETVDGLAKMGTSLNHDDPIWFQPYYEAGGGGFPV